MVDSAYRNNYDTGIDHLVEQAKAGKAAVLSAPQVAQIAGTLDNLLGTIAEQRVLLDTQDDLLEVMQKALDAAGVDDPFDMEPEILGEVLPFEDQEALHVEFDADFKVQEMRPSEDGTP